MEKGLTKLSLLVFLLLAACAGEKSALSDQEFATFYAEVAMAQRSAPDSTAAADSAMAVARRHGITKEELAELRQRMEQNPTKWIRMWERIVNELSE
jgi:acetyl-CoA acetyltransferase